MGLPIRPSIEVISLRPYALKEQLEKVLTSNQKLSPEVLRKVKELNNRITDDDNCIVFIGKLKTK